VLLPLVVYLTAELKYDYERGLCYKLLLYVTLHKFNYTHIVALGALSDSHFWQKNNGKKQTKPWSKRHGDQPLYVGSLKTGA